MRMLRNLAFACFALMAQGHCEEMGLQSWKETQAGDCRISFPAAPQQVQQSLPLDESNMRLVYDLYLAPYLDKGIFLLLVAQYPMPIPSGRELAGLEGLLKGILSQHPDNQLVYAEVVSVHKMPAINFLVQNGKNYFRGQALMSGNKLYLIAMEGGKQFFEETIFQKFLKSFSLQSQ